MTGGDFAEIFCEEWCAGGVELVADMWSRRPRRGDMDLSGIEQCVGPQNITSPSGLIAAAREVAEAVTGGASLTKHLFFQNWSILQKW